MGDLVVRTVLGSFSSAGARLVDLPDFAGAGAAFFFVPVPPAVGALFFAGEVLPVRERRLALPVWPGEVFLLPDFFFKEAS
ncbi:MAG: hypothetical protein KC729_16465 [Candidatus Eisenbacteria bacterium]|uniref:Uncharacterized protein n=1 Tax=Eiseniibacteriota bacterium TaxID=2212470 RepID=A0A956RQH6_UNCEI|nr:hypothetical protein [Candidatus Eisenbacteria bacterium]